MTPVHGSEDLSHAVAEREFERTACLEYEVPQLGVAVVDLNDVSVGRVGRERLPGRCDVSPTDEVNSKPLVTNEGDFLRCHIWPADDQPLTAQVADPVLRVRVRFCVRDSSHT